MRLRSYITSNSFINKVDVHGCKMDYETLCNITNRRTPPQCPEAYFLENNLSRRELTAYHLLNNATYGKIPTSTPSKYTLSNDGSTEEWGWEPTSLHSPERVLSPTPPCDPPVIRSAEYTEINYRNNPFENHGRRWLLSPTKIMVHNICDFQFPTDLNDSPASPSPDDVLISETDIRQPPRHTHISQLGENDSPASPSPDDDLKLETDIGQPPPLTHISQLGNWGPPPPLRGSVIRYGGKQ